MPTSFSMRVAWSHPSRWCGPWKRSTSSATSEKLLVLLPREPYPLYRALELNGFTWQTKCQADGTVEVLIQHQAQ
jgi:hypothetical protein